tara:strand:+ start:4296 stop:4955 length:660 start_codon:yes stop_codon:yes gene_type:complete
MFQKILSTLFEDITTLFIFKCLISIFIGYFISFSLIISGQYWAKSFSNITTYCILPLIGLVITTVISGNIALSLGMVGALSIIRFRHPVKSPLELSIYFLLLTVGITVSSSLGKAIVLAFLSMSVIYLYSYYRKLKTKDPLSFPSLSYIRENPQYTIDILTSKKNAFISQSKYLLFSSENIDKSLNEYKLAFGNKETADEFKKKLDQMDDIKEIRFSCI